MDDQACLVRHRSLSLLRALSPQRLFFSRARATPGALHLARRNYYRQVTLPNPKFTGVGGTNLHGVELQTISKHKFLNINVLYFTPTS